MSPSERREFMAVIKMLAGHLADPSDERECDCEGDGLDWEGGEWTLCECVLKKLKAQADPEAVETVIPGLRHAEGQECAYRVAWRLRGMAMPSVPFRGGEHRSAEAAQEELDDTRSSPTVVEAWVERALLGTWEKLD